MTDGLCIASGSCITASGAADMPRSNTLWRKRMSNFRYDNAFAETINGLNDAEVIRWREP
jgi:hypothetical protein